MYMLPLPPLWKAFGKDPLNSDKEEEVNSETESERDDSDIEPETSKEDENAGIVGSPFHFPLVSFKIFIFISNKNKNKEEQAPTNTAASETIESVQLLGTINLILPKLNLSTKISKPNNHPLFFRSHQFPRHANLRLDNFMNISKLILNLKKFYPLLFHCIHEL